MLFYHLLAYIPFQTYIKACITLIVSMLKQLTLKMEISYKKFVDQDIENKLTDFYATTNVEM